MEGLESVLKLVMLRKCNGWKSAWLCHSPRISQNKPPQVLIFVFAVEMLNVQGMVYFKDLLSCAISLGTPTIPLRLDIKEKIIVL